MYNGIGLLTPRGSGTSGHVQANAFNIRSAPQRLTTAQQDANSRANLIKKPNEKILEHQRKRDIELKLLELAEDLEAKGYSAEEVETEVNELRQKMLAESQSKSPAEVEAELRHKDDTHALAKRKESEMNKFGAALGIRDAKEGEAFDKELVAKRRQEKQEARMREEAEALEEQLRKEEEEEIAAEKAKQALRKEERRKRKAAKEAEAEAARAEKRARLPAKPAPTPAETQAAAREGLQPSQNRSLDRVDDDGDDDGGEGDGDGVLLDARRAVRRAQGYYDRDDASPARFGDSPGSSADDRLPVQRRDSRRGDEGAVGMGMGMGPGHVGSWRGAKVGGARAERRRHDSDDEDASARDWRRRDAPDVPGERRRSRVIVADEDAVKDSGARRPRPAGDRDRRESDPDRSGDRRRDARIDLDAHEDRRERDRRGRWPERDVHDHRDPDRAADGRYDRGQRDDERRPPREAGARGEDGNGLRRAEASRGRRRACNEDGGADNARPAARRRGDRSPEDARRDDRAGTERGVRAHTGGAAVGRERPARRGDGRGAGRDREARPVASGSGSDALSFGSSSSSGSSRGGSALSFGSSSSDDSATSR